jgi:DNA-nicking Smr family endonuclease
MKDKRTPRRAMTDEEKALWQHVTRSARPLGKKREAKDAEEENKEACDNTRSAEPGGAVSASPPTHQSHSSARQASKSTRESHAATSAGVARQAQGQPAKAPPMAAFEPKRARRIATGRIAIEARIDLHGMRQHEAHVALRRFLLSAHARGLRVVKVITGKGGTREREDDMPFDLFDDRQRGVLRRLVPIWLAESDLRAIVVSFTPAGRGHGGEGALYVHLRRSRKR